MQGENLRIHGKAPRRIVLVHGGPGAAGELSPVARYLALRWGILEPLQTEVSLQGQILELKTVLEQHAELPATLVGYSWGAWLSLLTAVYHPALVGKLILVSSGPFEERYAVTMHKTRLSRLNDAEREEIAKLSEELNRPGAEHKQAMFARFGELFSRTDAFEPIEEEPAEVDYRHDIFLSVWKEAAQLRRSKQLLKLVRDVRCPVVAIHGDHDPHPQAGVERPLREFLPDFRFYSLEKCGHKPWHEQHARDEFYQILEKELQHVGS